MAAGERSVAQSESPLVGVIMGSDSDLPTMLDVVRVLKQLEVGWEINALSAHRTPHRVVEYVAGRVRLRNKVRRYRPAVVALVGVTVYRAMFPERRGAVRLGLQPERIGSSAVFVLPNPSGRNANFSYAEMLAAFRGLRRYVARN